MPERSLTGDDEGPAWLEEACERLDLSGEQGDRLRRQLRFLVELDRAKSVLRQTSLMDGSRREDDAGHMWHVAMAAMVLAEHARESIDAEKLMAMLLVHDIVEIDAGDTFVYDTDAGASKADRERRAADRLFGMLPADQAAELRSLWEEHETRSTPEARMAASIDRLMPIMANRATRGRVWRAHGVTAGRVRAVNAHSGEGSPVLGQVIDALISTAVEAGDLPAAGLPT